MAADYPMLMKHEPQLVLKAPDDMTAQVKAWIADHKDAEAKRMDAERAKIRAEEEARATAKAKAEQEAAEAQRKAAEEAAAKIERDRAQPATTLSDVLNAVAPQAIAQALATEPAAQPAAPAVTQAIPPAPVVAAAIIDNGRYIRLGEINALLGFTVTAEFLAGLGFAATQDKNARLYRECDFPAICRGICEHIAFVASVPAGMRKAA